MPRTLDPAKYPPEYLLLLDRAQSAPVVIPDAKPAGLRGYIQSFFRACEAQVGTPLAEKAKALQATSSVGDPSSPDPARQAPHVLVQRRENSAYARSVARALGTDSSAASMAAAADLASRLGH